MPLIDHIDGANRLIYLDVSTMNIDIHPIDIYKEMRTSRAQDEELRKYNLFLEAGGNIKKTPTTATERYVIELEGTRIVPWDSSHVLTVVGTIITDDGRSGIYCFDRTSLSPSTTVDINYVPPQVEIITIGSCVTDQDKLDIANKVWAETVEEMAQSALPEIPTTEQILNYLYVRLRNKSEQTSSEHSVYDNTGTTKLFKAGVSDDGTTFTKEKYESG